MKIFSSKIHLDSGLPLGGNDPDRMSAAVSDALEVNGLSFVAGDGKASCLCAIDALYPGRLVNEFEEADVKFILAASHTHYAPMLDDNKQKIGRFSESAVKSFARAIREASSVVVEPTVCRMFRGEVDVPIYRRFDYPASWINSLLTRYGGLYPNKKLLIDKGVYIFDFASDENSLFVIVYHACHPVSRGGANDISSDYVGILREAIRKRFGVENVIFFQGCAGDIRPDISRKRVSWLPKSRLNWRFNPQPDAEQQEEIDNQYISAVHSAVQYGEFQLKSDSMSVLERKLCLKDGTSLTIPRIEFGDDLIFSFMPFEISHLFHLDGRAENENHFTVSCCGNTLGYLSHPSQHKHGGYEVDGALPYMGLKEKLEISRGLF